MSEGGLEPPRPFEHWHLKPARLPFRHSPEGRYDDSDSDQCIHHSFTAHLGIGACGKIINMSDSGSRVANPADLRDASRERLLAEIGLLQHQYSLTDSARLQTQIVELETQIIQLERGLADSKMRLLQARDYARGCAAELGEAQINFATHQQLADRQVIQARKKNQAIYASRTWKIGRLVMLPSRIVRRLLKAG